MSKQIAAVLIPLVVVGAVVIFIISSMKGTTSGAQQVEVDTMRSTLSDLDKRLDKVEGYITQFDGRFDDLRTTTLQLTHAVNELRKGLAVAGEESEGSELVAQIEVPDSLQRGELWDAGAAAGNAGGPGGRGGREKDPEKEAERAAKKAEREAQKAQKEASKLVAKLGLEEYQGQDIVNIYEEATRRKQELEEQKRSGSLSRDEFKELEKAIKTDRDAAIQALLTADQLELYNQKGGKGGPGGKDGGAGGKRGQDGNDPGQDQNR